MTLAGGDLAPDDPRAAADEAVRAALGADGPLARSLPGFTPREEQREMAVQVAKALDACEVLVAEAGTGTGKTFAYLVPALLSGRKILISTGTKTLQDQLFKRDLPTVRKALNAPVNAALLKGRANYVCHYHLARNGRDARFQTPQDAAHLQAIARFAVRSDSGDKAECAEVPEESAAWAAATSTRDNCLGQECPNVKECFVLAARRRALDADLVVVNHHLFFADVMLRDEGMAELLPAARGVIFDEAHQLPETASLFFGESVTTGQLVDLARDTRSETIASARDCRELIDATRNLEKAARDLRLAVGAEPGRRAHGDLVASEGFQTAVAGLDRELDAFLTVLESQAERSEGLAACLRRAQEAAQRLAGWRDGDGTDLIRWAEIFPVSLSLNATPLHVAPIVKRHLQEAGDRAWIFTSATLAVGRDFSHYLREMGLDGLDPPPTAAVWGSPFRYEQQALLYAPRGMPDPNSPAYAEAMVKAILPLVAAARGRTFVLCTALRAMRRVHDLLEEALRRRGLAYPLLRQGDAPRGQLLERFRRAGNAVLVASQSFWEGVDVPGEALSLVVIDKLPFAPPDDPVLAARVAYLESQGQSPFFSHQLPRAVIAMKQGAGRLIRTERDRGVLAICDPRMIDRSYGKLVWRSLPAMARTREEAEVVAFLAALSAPADGTESDDAANCPP
ncbi:MAG: ATP-dependent DNA helicase [Zoogloeaceae bacterium]|nr:ATP-dependent DNA helicase [Zoogloeaceae bacterium]